MLDASQDDSVLGKDFKISQDDGSGLKPTKIRKIGGVGARRHLYLGVTQPLLHEREATDPRPFGHYLTTQL